MDQNRGNAPDPSAGEGHNSVLADYLAQCQAAVAECFRNGAAGDLESTIVATRLIKTSLILMAVLDDKPTSTHRSIVEHLTPPQSRRSRRKTPASTPEEQDDAGPSGALP